NQHCRFSRQTIIPLGELPSRGSPRRLRRSWGDFYAESTRTKPPGRRTLRVSVGQLMMAGTNPANLAISLALLEVTLLRRVTARRQVDGGSPGKRVVVAQIL